jgi:hypothetical protein
MLVADRRSLPPAIKPPANVQVALEVDGTRFLETFLSRLHI